MVARYADEDGALSNVTLGVGKTAAQWAAAPLQGLHAAAPAFARDSYKLGEVAKLTWHSPFSGGPSSRNSACVLACACALLTPQANPWSCSHRGRSS